ncbi:MAG: DUF3987 domain-containing protein [Cyclobacteriaceae bacterium]|nr:DUF3987 domain-containing protein [Cyclobacteriaceae bacterium]
MNDPNTVNTTIFNELKKLSSITGEAEVNLENLQSIEAGINEEVFNSCPQVLSNLLNQIKYRPDKETFLVSFIAFVSGILPNYFHIYDGSQIEANLYLYIVGDYAQGKGAVKYSKKTLNKIESKFLIENDQILKEFKGILGRYKAELEEAKSSKNFDRIAELETDSPEDPKLRKLFFSLNNSESNLLKDIKNNGERAIFFSSEGDSVTDSIGREYNKIRPLLNQSFHHEEYSHERLTASKNLKSPKVSLLVTSTIDQFMRLIKDPNDGFFSRFLIFRAKSNKNFKSPWGNDNKGINFEIEKLSDFNLRLFEFLESCQGSPIEFVLTKSQKQRFLEIFQAEKNEAIDTEKGLVGIVHRRGLIFVRVAMIFAIIKRYENNSLTKGCRVECDDSTFELTLSLMNVFFFYGLSLYHILPKSNLEPKIIKEEKAKVSEKMEWIRLHETGMSSRKIAKQLYGDDRKHMTIYRYISEYKAKI